MLQASRHRFFPERVASDQVTDEGNIAEVREEGAIAGQEHLLRIMATETACLHLAFEVLDSTGEDGLEGHAEFDVARSFLGQRLPSHDPDEIRVGLEEVEARGDHVIELLPPVGLRLADRVLHALIPFGEGTFEDLAIHGLLGREVMQEALATDSDLVGDHVQRGAVEAALGKEMPCCHDDRLLGVAPNHELTILALRSAGMQIIAALFIDEIDLRQVAGPATRIDLSGIQFSAVAPSPLPLTWAPHLVVMIHCPTDGAGRGVLEVTFHRGDEQIARNVQPFDVEPGKFTYRLVRAELDFAEYGTIEARCRLDQGATTTVPYTLLAPPADG